MKIIDCVQGTDEWLLARAGIATASCFADILAKGRAGAESTTRANYRARLVVERLTGRCVQGFKSPAMQQGTEREPLARTAYEIQSGALVDQIGFIRHDDVECGGSPDGLIGSDGALEIKCPELPAHLEYLRSPTAPPKYVAQIQGCLWLAEREWCDFVSFNPDFPPDMQLVVRRVRRDDKCIRELEFMVRAFMDEVRAEEAEVRSLRNAA